MRIKMEEIKERYKLEQDTADLVQSEIETFADWLKEYGPMTWYSGEGEVISEHSSNLVWTRGSLDSDVQSVANGFDADDYPEILSEGYFVATKPCNEEPYSVYVSTDLYLSCNNCSESENDSEDCRICTGDGYFWLDIVELFDEIKVASN